MFHVDNKIDTKIRLHLIGLKADTQILWKKARLCCWING